MTVRDSSQSVCSCCGLLLHKKDRRDNRLYESHFGYQPDVRTCIKCGYMTDISLRQTEDEKHTQYHNIGKDPEGGKFNIETNNWIGGKGGW